MPKSLQSSEFEYVQVRRFLLSPVPPPVVSKSFLVPEQKPPGEVEACVPL